MYKLPQVIFNAPSFEFDTPSFEFNTPSFDLIGSPKLKNPSFEIKNSFIQKLKYFLALIALFWEKIDMVKFAFHCL